MSTKKEMIDHYKAMTIDKLKDEFTVEYEGMQKLTKQKKENEQIQEFKSKIKSFVDEHVDEKLKKDRKKIMDEFSDHKKSLLQDKDIVEDVENKKALEQGYNGQIKIHRDATKIISALIYDKKVEKLK